eukprot:m.508734 g.508734  ORF g.508734 m.508734 type:complete len:684 (+) comp21885_c0_seq1:171-2222(+)
MLHMTRISKVLVRQLKVARQYTNPPTLSATQAIEQHVRSGARVLIGSGAAEPQHLVEELCLHASTKNLSDIQLVHLMTLGTAPYANEATSSHVRHNAFFIGANVRNAVRSGMADYTPCRLWDIPTFFRTQRLPIDGVIVQCAPPRDGFISLGVSVDILKSGIESANFVLAQVNPNMPWTIGDSLIPVSSIDAFVEHEEPLCELQPPALDIPALWIGKYVANLVPNGACLQLGIGGIPDAVLAALKGKRDLGIHTEMISDGVLDLIDLGVVNGSKKNINPGAIVTSFCMGTRRLYDTVHDNPLFQFRPTEYTNDPFIISQHDNMISINSALGVDLTGQVAADSLGHRFYSGVGGQVDFVRGALRSKGGRSVIALPSTAKHGETSRITLALASGTGVVTPRADVDFVVTEYGIASLRAKTVCERAIALIQLAHPKFREQLMQEAMNHGLIDTGHILPAGHDESSRYDIDLEGECEFVIDAESKNDSRTIRLHYRPLKPSDERNLKDLFYRLPPESAAASFGLPVRNLTERQFQQLVSIDSANSVAVAFFAPEVTTRHGVNQQPRDRLIAVARYEHHHRKGLDHVPATVVVDKAYQGNGIGAYAIAYLASIAKKRDIFGFEVMEVPGDTQMERILSRVFESVDVQPRCENQDANTAEAVNVPSADGRTRLRVDLDCMTAAYASRFT